MSKLTIEHLKTLRESEDKVEFKRAAQGNFAYDGGSKPNPKDRRKCILGYVTALCNVRWWIFSAWNGRCLSTSGGGYKTE